MFTAFYVWLLHPVARMLAEKSLGKLLTLSQTIRQNQF